MGCHFNHAGGSCARIILRCKPICKSWFKRGCDVSKRSRLHTRSPVEPRYAATLLFALIVLVADGDAFFLFWILFWYHFYFKIWEWTTLVAISGRLLTVITSKTMTAVFAQMLSCITVSGTHRKTSNLYSRLRRRHVDRNDNQRWILPMLINILIYV